MPIYDYKCIKCGYLDTVLAGSDEDKISCRKCGDVSYKQMGAPAFRIKGYSEKNGYSNNGKKD